MTDRAATSILSRRAFLLASLATAAALRLQDVANAAPLSAPRMLPLAQAAKGGTLIIGRGEDAEHLDPGFAGSFSTIDTVSLIYDTLTVMDMDKSIKPSLAESWDISPDGTVYTFKLRSGITFHDGTPFNAAAVKANFDRIMDPNAGARGAAGLRGLTQTDAVDDQTVRFTLSAPFGPFLQVLAGGGYGIPSPTAVSNWGPSDYGKHPVGTGPFAFKEWVPADHITLVKNPNYQSFLPYAANSGPPYLDEVTFRVIPETQALIAALEAGEVLLAQLPPSQVRAFQDRSGFQVLRKPEAGTLINFVEFNFAKPPFDDVNVRKAFAYALDVDSIINSVIEGQAARNYGFMPVGLLGWTQDLEASGYHFDPQQAARLLDQAGWMMGPDNVRQKGGQKLELQFYTFTIEPFSRVAELMQAQAAQSGFKLNIQTFEVATDLQKISQDTLDHHLDLINWGSSNSYLLQIMTHSKQPLGRYTSQKIGQSATYDQLINSAIAESDPQKASDLYVQAQKVLLADAAAVPLYTDIYSYALNDRVQDFKLGPVISSYLGVLVYQDAYVTT
jgi:peptide/nickel transport system substrate-binding protein